MIEKIEKIDEKDSIYDIIYTEKPCIYGIEKFLWNFESAGWGFESLRARC